MKRLVRWFNILWVVIFMLVSIAMANAVPLNGTYTIGGTTPDYLTISTAMNALNTDGVSGPVIFNVRAGTYTGQATLNAITGVSATNTITFQKDPAATSTPVITYTPNSTFSNYTVRLNVSKHVSFKNLEFKSTGTTFSTVFSLTGHVEYISFDSCTFIGATTGIQTDNSILICAFGSDVDYLEVTNCTFSGGSNALYIVGADTVTNPLEKPVITGNVFTGVNLTGIRVQYSDSATIKNNKVTFNTTALPFGPRGINLQFGTDLLECSGNEVTVDIDRGCVGLNIDRIFNEPTYKARVYNNMVSLPRATNNVVYGMQLYQSKNIEMHANSVLVKSISNSSAGLFETGSTGSSLMNNIFKVTHSGARNAVYSSNGTALTLDHNCYVHPSSNGPNATTTITSWQSTSSNDLNSIISTVSFLADTNLRTTDVNVALKGTAISYITTDIDGNPRNSSTPDIGAAEFSKAPTTLSGTYTIGGTTPDFNTIGAAVDSLNNNGIHGAVIFNIRSGTYTEQLELNRITGSSFANTVLFQSDPTNVSDVIIQFTGTASKNFVWELDSIDYLKFKKLNFKSLNTSRSIILSFTGVSSEIEIDSCNFTNAYLGGTGIDEWNSSIYDNKASGVIKNMKITHCDFTGGSSAINLYSTTTNPGTRAIIEHNTIDSIAQHGIYLYFQDTAKVKHNEIQCYPTASQPYGIRAQECDGGLEVMNNNVNLVSGFMGRAALISNCTNTTSLRGTIANNVFYMRGTNTSICMETSNNTFMDYYFNTFFVDGPTWAYALRLNTLSNCNIKNNIFYNAGSDSKAYCMYVVNTNGLSGNDVNYNCYSSNSVNVGNYNLSAITSFSAWKTTTSSESNGINTNPNFVDTISSFKATNSALAGAGVQISGLTVDADGNTRSNPPGIGAFSIPDNRLSGTYTIGASGSDYSTVSAAAAALDTHGVKGPVIFNIRSGTYTEQVEIVSVTGASGTNTVTFQNDPLAATQPVIEFSSSSSAKPYTIHFSGCDYVTLKGVKVRATGSQAHALYYSGLTDSIVVDSCVLEGRQGVTGNQYMVVKFLDGSTHQARYCTIKNSDILYGYYAVQMRGASTNRGLNNQLVNNTISGYLLRGVELYYQDSVSITSNQLIAAGTTTFTQQGIVVFFGGANSRFINNRIELNTNKNAFGIQFVGTNGVAGKPIKIINNTYINTRSPISTANDRGIQVNGNYYDIYNNTLLVTSSDVNNGTALQITSGNNYNVKNNNLINRGGGFAFYAPAITTWDCDYNNLYATGTNIGYYNSNNYTTLAAWQIATSKDANSQNINPDFIADTLLRPNNGFLNNLGTVLTEVPEDIEGVLRDISNPDIGAFEFTGVDPRLSGTYSVGGAASDYASPKAAVAALDSHGVKGPVVFNILSGTYTEQIIIDSVSGANATNTITFQKDPTESSKPVITYAATVSAVNFTVRFNGADHITFKNLKVEATGTTYGRVLSYHGLTDYIAIDSCELTGVTNATSVFQNLVNHSNDTTTGVANYCSITNSIFSNGYSSVYLYGAGKSYEKGNVFEGNQFLNYQYRGIDAYYQDSMQMVKNTFRPTASTGDQWGLHSFEFGGNTRLEGNAVILLTSGKANGYDIRSYIGGASSKTLVINNTYVNAVANSSAEDVGFSLENCVYLDFYFNTASVRSTSSLSGNPLLVDGGSNFDILNNNLYNSGGGFAYRVDNTPTTFTSNYNNLFVESGSIARFNGSNASNFVTWQSLSGQGTNSQNIRPNFISDTTLIPNNILLNDKGSFISSVTEDFSGTVRNVSTPDIGAFEFTGIQPPMAGIYTVGGTTPAYPTLIDAVADLNSRGVSDTVDFYIRSGTYTGKLEIDSVAGASQANWIRFRNDPANTTAVLIQGTVGNEEGLVLLKTAAHITFKNLQFDVTQSTFGASGIRFENKCDSIQIDSCEFGITTSGWVGIGTFFNNGKIEGEIGYLKVTASTFNDLSRAAIVGHGGGSAGFVSQLEMTDNTFNASGVWSELDTFRFTNNEVNNALIGCYFGGRYSNVRENDLYEGQFYFQFTGSLKRSLFANNVLYTSDFSNDERSILSIQGASNMDVLSNTIVAKSASNQINKIPVLIDNSTGINMVNNNLVAQSGSPVIRMLNLASIPDLSFSYNNYWTGGDTLAVVDDINLVRVTSYIKLSELDNDDLDTNSVSIEPYFLADTLLKPYRESLNDKGITNQITTDLTGAVRASTPDIGAFEFDPIIVDVLLDSIALDSFYCSGEQTVKVRVKNLSDTLIRSSKLTWSIGEEGSAFKSSFTVSSTDTLEKDSLVWINLGQFTFTESKSYEIQVSIDSLNQYRDNDASNNSITDTITILQNPVAGITAAATCIGDSVKLIGAGGVRYQWSGPNGHTDTLSTSSIANASNLSEGEYLLIATDINGCFDSTKYTLALDTLPLANLKASDTICTDSVYTLAANAQSQYSYLWNNGESTSTIQVDSAFKYKVTVTDHIGCSSSDSFELVLNPLPIVSFNKAIEDVCSFGSVIQLNHAIPSGGVYSGGTYVSGNTIVPQNGGNYPLRYTYTDANNCVGIADTTFTVRSRPIVSLTQIDTLCTNSGVYNIIEATPFDSVNGSFTSIPGLTDTLLGTFDPLIAGAGNHVITYTFTDTATGCFATDTTVLTVNDTFALSFSTPNVLCENDTTLELPKANGINPSFISRYAGTGIVGNHAFNPTLVNLGVSRVKYEVVNDKNCLSTDSVEVTVRQKPTLNFTLSDVCVNAPDFTLTTATPSGTGGTYTGRGVSGGVYSPANAGTGLDTVTYRYVDPTSQCSDTIQAYFQVFDKPALLFSLPQENTARCIDADTFTISGQFPVDTSNNRTVFSGNGVTGYTFDPKAAQPGIHLINFSYTDQNGCTDSTKDTVVVHDLPVVTFTYESSICQNRNIETITNRATPAGGVFSGVGITDTNGTFNPALVGTGSQKELVYTYTNDTTGCINSDTTYFDVDTVTTVSLSLIPDFCINSSNLVLNQGSVDTGNIQYQSLRTGVLAGHLYQPIVAGVGADTIRYTFTNFFGCIDSTDQVITVNDTPTVQINLQPQYDRVCENEAQFNIVTATPTGGVFSANSGFIGNKFNPSNAVKGTNQILYSYTDANGCLNVDSAIIFVDTLTTISHLSDSFCLNDADEVIINGIAPQGGISTYSGIGMVNDSVFSPALAGIGAHTIVYEYENANNCISKRTATYQVFGLPTVQFTQPNAICMYPDTITLVGASGNGDISYFFGSGGLLDSAKGTFLPPLAGPGNEVIGYTSMNLSTGCADSLSRILVIDTLPIVAMDTFPEICINEGAFVLAVGQPVNRGVGVYSGTGVITGTFDPAIAKVGTHKIAYTYTDLNGCTASDSESVKVNALPVVTLGALADICISDTNRILSSGTPLGGYYKGAYTDSATSKFSPDSVGVWSITYHYTDTNKCKSEAVQNIQVRDVPNVQLVFRSQFCANETPVQLTGGGTPIGGVYTAKGVVNGNYDPGVVTTRLDTMSYVYTDAFGCFDSDTLIIELDTATPVQKVGLPELCKGAGSLNLVPFFTPSGGTYAGVSVFNTQVFVSQLDTGSYPVSYTYTDTNQCVTSILDTLRIRPLPSFEIGNDTSICEGESLTITASGDYKYEWSNGQYTSGIKVSPRKSSVYNVTATNVYNCVSQQRIGVTVNSKFSVFTTSTAASCKQQNGAGFASVSGGVKPIAYTWSNGERTSDNRGLAAGTYEVTATDANQCSSYGIVSISNENGPEITLDSLVHNVCHDDEQGKIALTIQSNTAYTVSWNNGARTEDLSGLAAGIYELTVIDDQGCITARSYTVEEPEVSEYDITALLPDCDSANGELIFKQLAGTLVDSLLWSTGVRKDTLTRLTADVYTAYLLDKNGCRDTMDVVLENNATPTILRDSIVHTACGKQEGKVVLSSPDSIQSYNWSNSGTGERQDLLAAGTYYVTVTDTAGCKSIDKIEINPTKLGPVPICVVSNDTSISLNEITWDTTGIGANQYYIYRESGIRNQYFRIGQVSGNGRPLFIDSSFNISTKIGRYAVAAVSACETESDIDMIHRTTLLWAKKLDSSIIQLSWNDYTGIAANKVYVYRSSTTNGIELLDSIISGNTYVDYNAPKGEPSLFYFIATNGAGHCGTVRSISNYSADFGIGVVGISEQNSNAEFAVWPNPNNGTFKIKLTGFTSDKVRVVVYNQLGELMANETYNTYLQGELQSINLFNATSGTYFIQVIGDGVVQTREMIINR